MKVGKSEIMLSGFPASKQAGKHKFSPASREAIWQACQKEGIHESAPSGLKPEGIQIGRLGGCGWPIRRQLATRDPRVNWMPCSHKEFLNDGPKTYKKDGKPDGLPVGKIASRAEGKIASKLA